MKRPRKTNRKRTKRLRAGLRRKNVKRRKRMTGRGKFHELTIESRLI